MEQTSHIPVLSLADLASLRHDIRLSLITQARMLLTSLQAMDAPKTPQEVSRHARALLAISRAFDRLLPDAMGEEETVASSTDTPASMSTQTHPLNRQQRRKAEAKARKGGGVMPRHPGTGVAPQVKQEPPPPSAPQMVPLPSKLGRYR